MFIISPPETLSFNFIFLFYPTVQFTYFFIYDFLPNFSYMTWVWKKDIGKSVWYSTIFNNAIKGDNSTILIYLFPRKLCLKNRNYHLF